MYSLEQQSWTHVNTYSYDVSTTFVPTPILLTMSLSTINGTLKLSVLTYPVDQDSIPVVYPTQRRSGNEGSEGNDEIFEICSDINFYRTLVVLIPMQCTPNQQYLLFLSLISQCSPVR